MELKTPPQTKASKLLRDAPPRDPLLVGLIGCGRLGTQLANCLLTYADVQSSELLISTRRPELLSKYIYFKLWQIFGENRGVVLSVCVAVV